MKHPALRVIVIHYLSLLTRVLSRKLKKHPKNWIFKFFPLITFFLDKITFLQAEAWAAAASRAAAENFFTFISFFVYFNLKNWIQPWKFQFCKNYQIWSFFYQNVKPSSGISTSIKPIDTLFLLHGISFDKKPFRKWPQKQNSNVKNTFKFQF